MPALKRPLANRNRETLRGARGTAIQAPLVSQCPQIIIEQQQQQQLGRPQEINAKEKQRETCGTMQYHARTWRDTNRGKHVLEQEESKNHRDTAATAVTATNRQNARERKRGMLAPSGDGM